MEAGTDDRCTHPFFDREKVDLLRSGLPPGDEIEEAVELLGALSNRTRLRIVHALSGGEELCVCDVAHLVGSSVSKASHHLGRLRAAGVVTFRSDGRMAYYRLSEPRARTLLEASLGAPERVVEGVG
jgi:ArsR family transcriptional regulator, lead/cadmium/zinc/bismuth-responsive transcriptional repressor